jgi:AraC-like DNA-binding protein
MPVLLDLTPGDDRTGRRDARDRATATMTALAPMTRITELDIPPGTTATIGRQSLGPISVVHLAGFDYHQVATTRTIDGVPAGISLAVRPPGRWLLSQAGTTRSGLAGDLVSIIDVTRAMTMRMTADTPMLQAYFSAEQLGLDVDALRAGAAAVERSPLRRLVARHLADLPRDDAATPTADIRQSLGQATVELVRAMVIGAARPEDLVGSELGPARLRRCVQRHVRAHLRDPALSPASIARAHAISVRHLHGLWRDEPTTLWQWVVHLRLEAVRERLADPGSAHRSIASVAREWCFTNPAHFARRFREEYGMTPRQWRDLTRGTGRGR